MIIKLCSCWRAYKSISDTTYLAEGIETGLSILESDKNARVMAVLSKSNFLNVDLKQLTDKVVMCLDNDGEKTFSDEIIKKAIVRLHNAGKTVSVVMPNKTGQDFNDVLRQEGVGTLKQQLNRIIDTSSIIIGKLQDSFINDRPLVKQKNSHEPLKVVQQVDLMQKIKEMER